eukprot:ctg_1307.g425
MAGKQAEMHDRSETTSAASVDDVMEDTSPPSMRTEGDLTGDGGVVKRVVRRSKTSWERPESGDEVSVHYVGRLQADGTQFDSSRDRDEPFEFKLDSGSVIKGWDLAVRSMAKGELAEFTIAPAYAYAVVEERARPVPGRRRDSQDHRRGQRVGAPARWRRTAGALPVGGSGRAAGAGSDSHHSHLRDGARAEPERHIAVYSAGVASDAAGDEEGCGGAAGVSRRQHHRGAFREMVHHQDAGRWPGHREDAGRGRWMGATERDRRALHGGDQRRAGARVGARRRQHHLLGFGDGAVAHEERRARAGDHPRCRLRRCRGATRVVIAANGV